jgi:blocked-early-in-transport protein 1
MTRLSDRSSLFDQVCEKPSNVFDREYNEHLDDTYDEEFSKKIGQLKNAVSTIKEISIDIRDEVDDQNNMLNDMNTKMDETSSSLHRARKKLIVMMNESGNQYMCYLVVFIVIVFLVLYIMVKYMYE